MGRQGKLCYALRDDSNQGLVRQKRPQPPRRRRHTVQILFNVDPIR